MLEVIGSVIAVEEEVSVVPVCSFAPLVAVLDEEIVCAIIGVVSVLLELTVPVAPVGEEV